MNNLIQTETSTIIYGDFKGKHDQELFRCPNELIDKDLKRYLNQYRSLLESNFVPTFENDYEEDLRNVQGKELIGYYRMYYSYGWAGKWFLENGNPTKIDCKGVQEIIDWFVKKYPKGCTFLMSGDFEDKYEKWGGENRYLIKPYMSEYYKIMVDTTFGNGDYPVRIYVYRDKKIEA